MSHLAGSEDSRYCTSQPELGMLINKEGILTLLILGVQAFVFADLPHPKYRWHMTYCKRHKDLLFLFATL